MPRPRYIASAIALFTLIVFAPAASLQFVNYDDGDYVSENSTVQAGLTWAGFKWAFGIGCANNWHPLTWFSHMLDCELFGLQAGAHHLVNVLFHAANAGLLFTLLWRLTRKIWPATFIAALFAWHPLHVESVAWVSERKDVLSAFFALLALLSYEKFAREKPAKKTAARRHYGWSLFFFALGLMAKPMLVTLPFLMLLLDWWPLQRFATPATACLPPGKKILKLAAEKWPFLILTGISCVLTVAAQSKVFHGSVAMASLTAVPFEVRLGNLAIAYINYLSRCFWPDNLAVFYPLPKVFWIPQVAISVWLLLTISVVAWRGRRSRPYLAMGWLWFLGLLVPVSGLVRVGAASFADRYTYLPLTGIFIMVAFAMDEIAGKNPALRNFFQIAAAVALAACILATEKQLGCWQNTETLFRHDLAVAGDNDVAHNGLGAYFEARGELTNALAHYQAAIRCDATQPLLHNNLANVSDKLGRVTEALAAYRAAIQLRPGDAAFHTGAGFELSRLSDFKSALAEFAEAEKLDPQYPWPHVETAEILFKLGHDAEGVDEFRAAVRLSPDNPQFLCEAAEYLAANETAGARDGPTALALALQANQLTRGQNPVMLDVLAMACAETDDFASAVSSEEAALKLSNGLPAQSLDMMRRRLELFQNHQPWRENFRAADASPKN